MDKPRKDPSAPFMSVDIHRDRIPEDLRKKISSHRHTLVHLEWTERERRKMHKRKQKMEFDREGIPKKKGSNPCPWQADNCPACRDYKKKVVK